MECDTCQSVSDKVEKMFTDTYLGDGPLNPSITTRLAMIENTLSKLAEAFHDIRKLVIGVIIAVAADIISHHIH